MQTHDYVSIYTPPVELAPSTTCLVVVDMMYATGHPDFGLGELLAAEGRFEEASYRFARIAEKVLPNTLRLLDWARAHDMRRVFLTYGSEVSDYSDLSPQMYELCRATKNREGNARARAARRAGQAAQRAGRQQDHPEWFHLLSSSS